MKSRSILIGALGLAPALTLAQVWDLKQDFSTTQNPNGAWQYGKYNASGVFSANVAGNFLGLATGWVGDDQDRPFVGRVDNAFNGVSVGDIMFHVDYPTAANPYAGTRWTSPISGNIDVTATFYAGDSASVSEFVSINDVSFIGQSIDQAGDWTITFSQNVVAGDYLDFFIGPDSGGSTSFTSTPVDIHITSSTVPEPASMAALGLGALSLIRRRRK